MESYLECQLDVEMWLTGLVSRGLAKKRIEDEIRSDNEVKMTYHERVVDFMITKGIYRGAPLYLSVTTLKNRGYAGQPVASRFIEQWDKYTTTLHKHNLGLIRDKEKESGSDYFTRFLQGITFDNIFDNALWRNVPPTDLDLEYDTLKSERPLVSYQIPMTRKRPRTVMEQKELKEVNGEVKDAEVLREVADFTRLFFDRALNQAAVNEMQHFIQTQLTCAINKSVAILTDARPHAAGAGAGADEDAKMRSPWAIEERLIEMAKATIASWTTGFADKDANDDATKQALSDLADSAAKKAAANTAIIVTNPRTMDYLSDYSKYIAVQHAEDQIAKVCQAMQLCIGYISDINAKIKRTAAIPSASTKRRKFEASSGDAVVIVKEVLEKITEEHARLLKQVDALRLVPRDTDIFEAQRKIAHDAALQLDYANWLKKMNYRDPQSLFASLKEHPVATPQFINWVLIHEDTAKTQAMGSVGVAREACAHICDGMMARVRGLRQRFDKAESEISLAKMDLDAQILLVKAEWKSLPVSVSERGELARAFGGFLGSLNYVKGSAAKLDCAPISQTAVKALEEIDIRGDTVAQVESSMRYVALGAAVCALVI